MQHPRRVRPSLSWLHRRPTVEEDGVYRDAVSPFGYFSLLVTEPVCRACLCGLCYALLLACLLCVYVGTPAGAWLLFVRSTSVVRPSLSPFLYPLHTLSPQYAHLFSEMPPNGRPPAKDHLGPRGSYAEKSYCSLRSLIREALSSYPPTSALGRCTFLYGLLELFASLALLFFVFCSLRRVASGFLRSSLEAYSKSLISARTLDRQGASSSSASPTSGRPQQKTVHQENRTLWQQKADPAAGTEDLLKGQVAVVTGVTSGVGKETALQLAKWGARVYFGARSAEQGRLVAAAINAELATVGATPAPTRFSSTLVKAVKQAPLHLMSSLCIKPIERVHCKSKTANVSAPSQKQGKNSSGSSTVSYEPRVHVHELDLCRAASVREFARWVLAATNGQVDILVNNAAQMCVPELTPVTFDDGACFEYHSVCNHMGHFLLTQLLLPALKRAAASAAASVSEKASAAFAAPVGAGGGRIINVASCAHVFHARGFSVLDAACTPETAAAAAAAIASDEASRRQHELLQCQHQQQEEERRTAESLLQMRRQSTAKRYLSWIAYANSKLCNLWFTKELQRQLLLPDAAATSEEVSNTKALSYEVPGSTSNAAGKSIPQKQGRSDSCVGVYAAHPGVVQTQLWRHIAAKCLFLKWVVMLGGKLVMKTPVDGAATTLFLCIAPKDMLHWGGYYADGSPSWVVPAALDRKAQRELWVVSESVCRSCLATAPAGVHMTPVGAT